MGQSAIKNPRRIFSQQGGGGVDPALEARVEYLEQNEYKITYFAEINAATGTITKPTGSTILLDQFFGGVDAYVSTIQNGQPTGNFPVTAGGVAVDVTSFDASGNFTLSGTPSGYPVALIYILKIPASSYQNLTITNILDMETISYSNIKSGSFGVGFLKGNGSVAVTDTATLFMPYTGTITGWEIVECSDTPVSSSIVIDVWKDTYANYPPTIADTITGTEKPTLSSATKNQDLTLSTWTTSFNAGDVFKFKVDSVSDAKNILLTIYCERT